MFHANLVPAVERAVMIMDYLASSQMAQGVSDIARNLNLPKSSVHGLCHTLATLGLLLETPQGFEIGSHSLRWSSAYLDKADLVRDFERLLATDQRLTDYTVTLSVMQSDKVVYIGCRNAQRPLGFAFQIGLSLPAVFTATGKAMLSHLSRQQRDQILRGKWPQVFTAHSVPDHSAFEKEMQEMAAKSYAIDNGQIRDGMYCIGAAILNDFKHPIAGIAISMTNAEAQAEKVEELGQVIADLARSLSNN